MERHAFRSHCLRPGPSAVRWKLTDFSSPFNYIVQLLLLASWPVSLYHLAKRHFSTFYCLLQWSALCACVSMPPCFMLHTTQHKARALPSPCTNILFLSSKFLLLCLNFVTSCYYQSTLPPVSLTSFPDRFFFFYIILSFKLTMSLLTYWSSRSTWAGYQISSSCSDINKKTKNLVINRSNE